MEHAKEVIMEKASGSIWGAPCRHMEASGGNWGNHLGVIWEASGDVWKHLEVISEPSGRHLGSIWEASTLGFPPCPKHEQEKI